MGYEYAKRKDQAASDRAVRTGPEARSPHVSMDSLRSALGVEDSRRFDLTSAMRARMENAFGMSFSGLRLYESQKVEDAGAEAVTRGNTVAFAPGRADFSSRSGQQLLGHELSHVASQARGQVRGGGFLDSASLEARADQEGARAAAGQALYAAAPGLSAASLGASGPVQAKKSMDKKHRHHHHGDEQDNPRHRRRRHRHHGDAHKHRHHRHTEAATEAATESATKAAAETAKKPFKPKDNKFVGTGLGKISSMSGSLGTFAGERLDAMEKPGEASLKQKVIGKAADLLHIDSLKDKDLLKTVKERTGFVKPGAGILSGINKVGQSYAAMEKAEEAGDEQGVVNAQFDMASGSNSTLSSGLSLGKNIAGKIGKKALKTGLGYGSSVLGMVGDTISIGKNAYNIAREHSTQKQLNQQQQALQKRIEERGTARTEDEDELLQTMQQAGDFSNVRETKAKFDLAGNAVGLLSSGAGFVSPEASAMLKTVKTGINKVGKEVEGYKTYKAQQRVADRKYHTEDALKRVQSDDSLKNYQSMYGLSDRDVKMAQLMSYGIKSGTEKEASDRLAKERTQKVLAGARSGNQEHLDMMKALHVDPNAEKAHETLYKKMGGQVSMDKLDSAYTDWRHNDFQAGKEENDKANEEIKKIGILRYYGGLLGTKIKRFGQNSWESVKTGAKGLKNAVVSGAQNAWGGATNAAKKAWGGAKKAGSFIKNLFTSKDARAEAWNSIKSGARFVADKTVSGAKFLGKTAVSGAKAAGRGIAKGANFVKDLATSKDARAEAWNSIKTGASNVAKSVKSGISSAWDTAKDYGQYKLDSLRDWYYHGVDQLNTNKDTYDQMGFLDRVGWSLKNMPARLTARFLKKGTEERKQKYMMRDRLAERLKRDREAEEGNQG